MSNRAQVIYAAGVTTGNTVTSGAASANVAIPNNANGTTARAVVLTASVAGGVHVKLGIDNTVTATANDLLIGADPIVINTRGWAWIAYIQEATAAKLNIAPLEDV